MHKDLSEESLRSKIKSGKIAIAGNAELKIFGTLKCGSGQRMSRENRVFFSSESEAKLAGFRPCGHCMRLSYLKWKNGFV